MTGSIVARRYAKALVKMAVEGNFLERLRDDLQKVHAAQEVSRELRNLLISPIIAIGLKKAVLAEIIARLDVDQIAENFFGLLLEKGRFKYLGPIVAAYEGLIDEKLNRVKAIVRTKYSLSPEEETSLKKALSELTGKEVVLSTGLDPSILGGLVAQIGGTILDGSLRGQLKQLKEELTRSTNYHGT